MDADDPKPFEFLSSYYDFNHLTPSIPPAGQVDGEDNWKHAIVYPGFDITNSDSYDGSIIMKYKNSGSGIGVSSSRVNDLSFSLPPFQSTDDSITIQFDFQSGHWGGGFGIGYDKNNDGRLHYSKGDYVDHTELGPSVFVGSHCNVGVSVRNPANSGTISSTTYSSVSNISCDNSDNADPSEWVRFRLVIDLQANGGQGSGNLEYMNLSRGDTNFQQVTSHQNLNLGLQSGQNNGADPNKWNGMWFAMEGRPYAIDNVKFIRIPD